MSQDPYGLQNQFRANHTPEELLRARIAELDDKLQTETVEKLTEKRKAWADALIRAREALCALTGEVL